MHGVFSRGDGRPRRAILTVLSGCALVGFLAACGGDDLAKANYQRTTVEPKPGPGAQGPGPSGPITDPAVADAALRQVDPCQLIAEDALAELGMAEQPSSLGWDECSTHVTDPGSKKIDITLRMGDTLIGQAEEASGSVAGLPRMESVQGEGCTSTAVTSKRPGRGIVAQINYPGGDPCRAGRTVLQNVVQRLHSDPPKFPAAPGSLVPVDPCAVVDEAVANEMTKGKANRTSSSGLHSCAIGSGAPTLFVSFRTGVAPSEGEDSKPVDIGGVGGFVEQSTTDSSRCSASWLHRPTGEGEGELASVDYSDVNADAATDNPCDKALKVATNIKNTLPQP